MIVLHLAKRFFGSLSRREPAETDGTWAAAQLLAGEQAIWVQLSAADRRHALGVARRTVELLGRGTPRPVVAAALLHDAGKVDSGLGPVGRALATVVDRRAGESRFARYRRHDEIGAAMLAQAGSDQLTIDWTRQHHWSPTRWTVDRHFADALKAADDD